MRARQTILIVKENRLWLRKLNESEKSAEPQAAFTIEEPGPAARNAISRPKYLGRLTGADRHQEAVE